MAEQQLPTIKALTHQVIREKLASLNTMDADLTSRLAAMYGQPGSSGPAPAALDRAEKTRDRARALLNGAGHLVPPAPSADGEAPLFAERDAVRLAISALMREDAEEAAVEAQQRAEALRPEWERLVRAWTSAAATFAAVDTRAEAFLEANREARFLSLSDLIGQGAISGRGDTLETVIKAAIAEGVVSEAEIRKAKQHAKG